MRGLKVLLFPVSIIAVSIVSSLAMAASPYGEWRTSALADHPLVGKIWSVSANDFVEEKFLLEAVGSARFVLIGEKHDNVDHHLLQARIIEGTVTAGDGIVFEMLSSEQDQALLESWRGPETDLDALGKALTWEKRGWYAWSHYRPIFDAAANGDAIPASGDLPRSQRRAVSRGFDALGPGVSGDWKLDDPLDEGDEKALANHIVDAHCGMLPEAAVTPVMNVQRARDASLANALLLNTETNERRYLIAGGGHTRLDYGAPWYLRARGIPAQQIVSISIREVGEDVFDPLEMVNDRADGGPVADFVWFTPRVDTQDPCEKFAEQLKALKKQE